MKKQITAKQQKVYRAVGYLSKEKYLALRARLILQNKTVSDWIREKADEFLAA